MDKLHSTPLSLGSLGLQTGKVTKSPDRIIDSGDRDCFYITVLFDIFSKKIINVLLCPALGNITNKIFPFLIFPPDKHRKSL